MEDLSSERMQDWMAFARLISFLTNKSFSWSVKPKFKTVKVYVNKYEGKART